MNAIRCCDADCKNQDPTSITECAKTERLLGRNASMVRNIVGRIHVSEDYLAAVRLVVGKLKNWKTIPRPLRRGVILAVLTEHCENRELFNDVTRGRI